MENTSNPIAPFDLRAILLRESQAMARYAFRNAKAVPGEIVEALETYAAEAAAMNAAASAPITSNSPATTVVALDIKKLSAMHERLTQIVTPASPTSIELFEQETANGNWRKFLGPVPVVRRMMALAGFFLVCNIIFSLSPEVGHQSSADMFSTSGMPLLLNELFLLCSAGLGATFAALFQVNRFIVTCTYDPKYEPSYWIKFVLGLIAGFMLSEMLDVDATGSAAAAGNLTRPVLAMLGGFSATVVYRILTRLTETVESLFQGNAKELLAAKEQAAKTRLMQQMNEDRLKLAAGLIDMQKLIATGATGELKEKLDKVVSDLIPTQLANDSGGLQTTFLSRPANAASTSKPIVST